MVRVFRMWRFVRLVNKENKLIAYKDEFLAGFFKDQKYKYVNDQEAISKFRVLTRNKSKKEYVAERTLKAVLAKKYLTPHHVGPFIRLEISPDKGDDFVPISGLVKVLFRELKFYEQIIATILTGGSLYGIYKLLMNLIDKIHL